MQPGVNYMRSLHLLASSSSAGGPSTAVQRGYIWLTEGLVMTNSDNGWAPLSPWNFSPHVPQFWAKIPLSLCTGWECEEHEDSMKGCVHWVNASLRDRRDELVISATARQCQVALWALLALLNPLQRLLATPGSPSESTASLRGLSVLAMDTLGAEWWVGCGVSCSSRPHPHCGCSCESPSCSCCSPTGSVLTLNMQHHPARCFQSLDTEKARGERSVGLGFKLYGPSVFGVFHRELDWSFLLQLPRPTVRTTDLLSSEDSASLLLSTLW